MNKKILKLCKDVKDAIEYLNECGSSSDLEYSASSLVEEIEKLSKKKKPKGGDDE